MRAGIDSFAVALCGVLLALTFAIALIASRDSEQGLATTAPPPPQIIDERFITVFFVIDDAGQISFDDSIVSAESARGLAASACSDRPNTCSVIVMAAREAPAGATVALLDSLYQFTPEVVMLRDNDR